MNHRRLTPRDLDAIAEIDRVCFPPGIAFSRDMFEEALDHPFFENWGVEENGKLIAFSIIYWAGPRAVQVITIDVLPGWRRRGIGDTLMRGIMETAEKRKAVRVTLQVDVTNEAAQAMYKKWGFTLRSRLANYYGRGIDAYLMDRTVEPAAEKNSSRAG